MISKQILTYQHVVAVYVELVIYFGYTPLIFVIWGVLDPNGGWYYMILNHKKPPITLLSFYSRMFLHDLYTS